MTCWLVAHTTSSRAPCRCGDPLASSRAPCGRGDPLKKLASRLPRRPKKAPRNDPASAKATVGRQYWFVQSLLQLAIHHDNSLIAVAYHLAKDN